MDPGKVTIMTSALGLTGPEAAEILRREKLPLSLSMKITYSFLLPMLMTMQNLPKKAVLIRETLEKAGNRYGTIAPAAVLSKIPERLLLPRDAFFAPHERVPLTNLQAV